MSEQEIAITIIFVIIFVVSLISLTTVLVTSRYMIDKLDKLKKQLNVSKNIISESDLHAIEYSNNILDYITRIISMTSTLKFNMFIESKYIDKTTRSQFKSLISETCILIHDNIRNENVKYDLLLFSRDFLDWYIQSCTINIMEKMLNEKINSIT